MVYNWAPYEDECYRLYIVEGRSAAEVQKYMKDKYDFEPSERGFEVQFKRWGFPSKRGTPEQNAQIEERIKQLWEANVTRNDMLKILKDEGFRLSEPQLRRIRQKNGWSLRGCAAYTEQPGESGRAAAARVDDGAGVQQPSQSAPEQVEQAPTQLGFNQGYYQNHPLDPRIQQQIGINSSYDDPSQALLHASTPQNSRVERLAVLQARSDELRNEKKRHRRVHAYGGLDPDPPGPPRFPSETTLDESKAFLHLNNATYQSVRAKFQSVCSEMGIVRKAGSAPGQWQHAKDRLMTEHEHLSREIFGPWNGVPREQKDLAVDAICMSVAKVMRRSGKAMTIADAKMHLGINPHEARLVRGHFYRILENDNFVSFVEDGLDHLNALKNQWYAESSVLQRALGSENDPLKRRAFDRLASDVLKRHRDDITRKDPALKTKKHHGPGPGPIYKAAAPKPLIPAEADQTESVNEPADGTLHGTSDGQTGTPTHPATNTLPAPTPYAEEAATNRKGHTAMGKIIAQWPPPNRGPSLAGRETSRKRKLTAKALEAQGPPPSNPEPEDSSNTVIPSHRSKLQQEQMNERRSQQAKKKVPEPAQKQAPKRGRKRANPPAAQQAPKRASRKAPQPAREESSQPSSEPASKRRKVEPRTTRSKTQKKSKEPSPPVAIFPSPEHSSSDETSPPLDLPEAPDSPSPIPQPSEPQIVAQPTSSGAATTSTTSTSTTPIAALFRLHPSSPMRATKVMWFEMLTTRTLAEIEQKSKAQFDDVEGRSVAVRAVEGILTDGKGGEAGFAIESDAELEAYLAWMKQGRCVFVVKLESVV